MYMGDGPEPEWSKAMRNAIQNEESSKTTKIRNLFEECRIKDTLITELKDSIAQKDEMIKELEEKLKEQKEKKRKWKEKAKKYKSMINNNYTEKITNEDGSMRKDLLKPRIVVEGEK